MKRCNNKKKFIIMLVFLLMIGLGIGYAVLTQQLTIDNTISYDSMKWNVGFTEVVDFSQYNPPENVILANVEISQDKKSLSVACDIGMRTDAVSCIGMVKITNDSTFDVILDSMESGSSISNSIKRDKYIKEEYTYFCVEYDDCSIAEKNYILKKGQSIYFLLEYKFVELTEDLLNNTGVSFSFEIDMSWIELSGSFNFTIDGVTYIAEEGMTWEEWVDSSYNTAGFYVEFNALCTTDFNSIKDVVPSDLIINGKAYYRGNIPCMT